MKLKVRRNFDLNNLKLFGFKVEPEGSYYYKSINENVEIQIQKTNNDNLFEKREVAIYSKCANYCNDLSLLYNLIINGIIEMED